MRPVAVALLVLLSALVAAPARGDSIVFDRDGNVWQAEPDGSRQTQVTTGGYARPTQADDGTIVAVTDKLLRRMDRGGRVSNSAGVTGGSGPLTPHVAPGGARVAYNYFFTLPPSPGTRTALSFADRETSHEEIYYIDGWSNPTWFGNDRVLMFDASSFTGDTLLYKLGEGAGPWYEDPDLSLSGGEVNAAGTRFAATDGDKIRLYRLGAPPPAMSVDPRCDLTGPNGSFFRPTWSPDGASLAWQEDDGIWVGTIDLDSGTCSGSPRLVSPGGRSPDWGPAAVSTPAATTTPPPSNGSDATPSPTATVAQPVTTGGTLPAPAPKLTAVVGRTVRRSALLRGLRLQARCDRPCRVTADLLVDRRTARRLRTGATRVGRATSQAPAARTITIRLRPTAKARRRLRRGALRSVTVRLQAVDRDGRRSAPVTRKLTVRR